MASIGLNPSTANGLEDDPTIAKEQRYALAWKCGFYVKVNAYGFRATEPKDMLVAAKNGIDIVGPENDAAIYAAIEQVKASRGILLAAWSNHITWERQAAIAAMAQEIGVPIKCLKVNLDGSAAHSLYQRDAAKPIPWTLPPPPEPRARAGARGRHVGERDAG